MFEYYNPHPKGLRVGDCVKRAFTKVLDMDYKEVSLALNRFKKTTGAKKFNSNNNWKPFIKKLGWKKLSFPAVMGEQRMNGYSFCKAYPKGKYVLRMAKHLSSCVDGVIYDTWDCREKCVYNAWEVK